MTKEQLTQRLQALTQERDKIIANVHAFNGAIEDCKYWLAEFEKAEMPVEPQEQING